MDAVTMIAIVLLASSAVVILLVRHVREAFFAAVAWIWHNIWTSISFIVCPWWWPGRYR